MAGSRVLRSQESRGHKEAAEERGVEGDEGMKVGRLSGWSCAAIVLSGGGRTQVGWGPAGI